MSKLRQQKYRLGLATSLALASMTAATLIVQSTPAGASANAQGIAKHEIIVGTTMPLTGGAASAGAAFRAGMEAAINMVNSHGGINGRKVIATYLDDQFTPALSVANFLRLTDQQKVFLIDTPVGSAEIPGSWPLVTSSGIPVWGPYLPPDPALKNVFILATPHQSQARVIVDFLKGKKIKSLAYLGQQNAYGLSVLSGVQEQARIDKIRVTNVSYTQTNSTDISAAVLAVKASNPQAVVLGTDNTQSVLFLKQAQQLGWKPLIIGDSSAANTGTLQDTGPAGSAAVGMYGALVGALPTENTPAVKAYIKAMNQVNPAEAQNTYAVQAYAQNLVLFQVLKEMGNKLTWANFDKTAQELRSFKTGLLPLISFGRLPKGHTGANGAAVAQWTGSQWKLVQNFKNFTR